ncbi:MAG: hypothetical protein C0392_05400 [Syntrophus sp. (in: bacteria)]|nr:hypothetical protein [Syntrophus sp. (in: bacteria)]
MKKLIVPIIFVIFLSTFALTSYAEKKPDEKGPVLDSAELFFKVMRAGEYKRIWQYLSGKSRTVVINNTYKAILKYNEDAKTGVQASRELIESDFRSGGPIAKSYWDGYLGNFNPDAVLEESRWEIRESGKDRAEILILHKRAEMPVQLMMFRENGEWKVGLMETFSRSRR